MSFTCRRGHYSVSDDYCDICGARNWNANERMGSPGAAAAVAPAPQPLAEHPGMVCPVCSTYREGGDRYCPNCAYDFETGESWDARAITGPAAAPFRSTALMIVVAVDPTRSNERGCPPPPGEAPEHVYFLDQPSMVIGREDVVGVQVPIQADPYVSRRHAEIVDLGGQWGIRDLGSTNGTKLNGSPLMGTEVRLLRPNDVIEVGCFSKLSIRDRSSQGSVR